MTVSTQLNAQLTADAFVSNMARLEDELDGVAAESDELPATTTTTENNNNNNTGSTMQLTGNEETNFTDSDLEDKICKNRR